MSKFALKRNFTKFGLVEGFPGPHRHTKFYRSGFKMWAYSCKNRENFFV